MKSNCLWTGVASLLIFVPACGTSVIDPIGWGPGGGSGQAAESGAGRADESAGRGGSGAAPNESAGDSGAASSESAGRTNTGDAGSGGSPGQTSCEDLRLLVEDAIKSSRACAQDSDCEQFSAPCLFPNDESCGTLYGVSKSAHAELASAYAGYQACAGQCKFANACSPIRIAQCSQGKCLDQPRPSAPTCATIVSQAATAAADQETCSAVVRVNSVSLAVTGHALVCGPRDVVDEAGARASAKATPTPDIFEIGPGDLLSGPVPSDLWLFHEIIGDFGHVTAVSAVNGKTVFWGGLFWSGNPLGPGTLAGSRVGAPEAPSNWELSEVGSGCYPSPVLTRRDWDVRTEPNSDPTATPQQAAERVLSSALIRGISTTLPLINATTIHYGESAASTLPVSEYIVIVNAAQKP